MVEHFAYMIEFAFAVAIKVKNTIVHHPVLFCIWIDVDTRHYTYTFDHPMRVTALLTLNQFHIVRMAFINNRVSKQKITACAHLILRTHIVPD